MATRIDERTELQKKLDESFKRYVLNGIALLEEKYGPGWVDMGEEVWGELFDIRDSRRCVLGGVGASLERQPDYGAVAEMLGINETEDAGKHGEYTDHVAFRYGFVTPSTATAAEIVGVDRRELNEEDVWDSLQRLWMHELRALGARPVGVDE